MNKNEILLKVKDRQQLCSDKKVDGKDLDAICIYKNPADYIDYYLGGVDSQENRIHLLDHALSQLLNKHKVPISFYKRCSAELQEEIFKEHITERNKKLLLRFIENKVRAVLSSSYGIIDDYEIFPVVFEELEKLDYTVSKFHQYDLFTLMTVLFNDASITYNNRIYTAGLRVTTSETGHSSVWIEPIVSASTCNFVNRRILGKQGLDLRIIHRGKIDLDRVRNNVIKGREIAQIGIIQVCEAWQEKITGEHALDFAKGIDPISNRMLNILEEEWRTEERISKARAVTTILELAQELPLFQKVQVEQAAGSFIGLFDNFENRIRNFSRRV